MTAVESTRAAFVADVIAHPDDDTPRLIFADWLEEQGEEARAEFVRLQCRLAEIEREVGREQFFHGLLLERDRLREREAELLSEVQDAVKAEWMAWTPGDDCWWEAWEFRRGFAEAVSLDAPDWLEHADALLQLHPLREVRLLSSPRAFVYDDGRIRLASIYRVHDTGIVDAIMPVPEMALKLLASEWPAITFTLPS